MWGGKSVKTSWQAARKRGSDLKDVVGGSSLVSVLLRMGEICMQNIL